MINAHFDEIRTKLDRLNALSDSINSLERQFDEANSIFRDTLKCSTDRLSTIARTLGSKSIKHGRVYHAAKVTVEQNQSECQRACVQFEQANKDHQFAKKAILEAEQKLREITSPTTILRNGFSENNKSALDPVMRLDKLRITADEASINGGDSQSETCDQYTNASSSNSCKTPSSSSSSASCSSSSPNTSSIESTPIETQTSNLQLNNEKTTKESPEHNIITGDSSSNAHSAQNNLHHSGSIEDVLDSHHSETTTSQIVFNAAKLSEQLNQAIMQLDEAEKRREQSEKQHLDCANRLMVAKENLIRLEREHGQSIRRSQLYFDEAKQFNAKLDSVKSNICRISKDILAAKKAYAQTLSELEQFSEDLHENSAECSAKEEVK